MSRDLYGGRGLALQPWQRTNVLAAATYLREQLAKTPDDLRCRSMYEGLLDVLDPARRAGRAQRELAQLPRSSGQFRQSCPLSPLFSVRPSMIREIVTKLSAVSIDVHCEECYT
jgi:hypothetical protein